MFVGSILEGKNIVMQPKKAKFCYPYILWSHGIHYRKISNMVNAWLNGPKTMEGAFHTKSM
jgi:hypothetical protein